MAQNPPQFKRPLLRIGSIAFLAGAIIAILSTAFHPSTEDPSNHRLVFAEYASSDSWIAIHIGQFAGVIMVFAGGFVALYRLLVQSESSMASVLAWIGLALAIMTASAFAILQAVDGISLKMAVDSWVADPPEEKAITFRVAEGIRFIDIT
jgi:ABC-type xylose transport system permease subunit